jgi:preprotein translocase subunit YajC
MRSGLKKNDRVVTIGGILGTVTMVQQGSDEVTIKVDENNNTKLRIKRSAIDRVVAPDGSAVAKKPSE